MTEATWATNELPEHGVSKSISTPPVWVSTSDLLSLFPALLLHIVRKDLWVGVRRSHELLKLFQVPIEKRGRGERETKGGSAREKSADKVRMQRMQNKRAAAGDRSKNERKAARKDSRKAAPRSGVGKLLAPGLKLLEGRGGATLGPVWSRAPTQAQGGSSNCALAQLVVMHSRCTDYLISIFNI
ncbi:unnamed protein product [Prunus armeniaca]|uniref:Uncharacterized protein n=1 Tax=Prunus armeniaca TaxID=36596 RepID=A0A6J5XJ28_PRUAR|nr:unnamed protein product [Prunus armeniaca]